MIDLTTQQSRLLSYLTRYLAGSGGVAPSYVEVAATVGCAGKSSAHRLVIALEERGFIRRLPHKARSIEIVDLGPLHAVSTGELLFELARRGIVLHPNPEVVGA